MVIDNGGVNLVRGNHSMNIEMSREAPTRSQYARQNMEV